MFKGKVNQRRLSSCLGVVVALLVFTVSITGCDSFRKKFVRKKKKKPGQLEIVPILEPIEYPKKVYTAIQRYRHHYSLWKVWFKDLMTVISEKEGGKRQMYIFEQVANHTQGMGDYLTGAKSDQMDRIMEDLNYVREDLKRPVPLQKTNISVRKLKNMEKLIRNDFKPELVEDNLKETALAE